MSFRISGLPVAPFAPLFGLPDAELAKSLGMPQGSIGPTRGRCLAKLRVLLANDPAWEAR